MTRGDRVARIVAFLMRHKRATARQLAEHFQSSQRAVYRDMRCIINAGLPVVGISADGYRWLDGGRP